MGTSDATTSDTDSSTTQHAYPPPVFYLLTGRAEWALLEVRRRDVAWIQAVSAWIHSRAGVSEDLRVVPVMGWGEDKNKAVGAMFYGLTENKAAGKPFSVDYLNGRDIDAVVRKTLDTTLAEMEKKFGTADMNAWLTPVAYKTFSSSSLMGSLAVVLGKIPAKIKDNGNENWNAIMKIDAFRLPIETLIPTGGQSWFINTSGTASPHISDQVERHRDLDFKSVATSDKDAAVAAVGTPIKLTFAP